MVGSQFVKAVGLANEWHVGQMRKATQTPYIAHLIAVAGLVLEAGGDEDMAIAALLHDAMEDAGVPATRIEEEFGTRVAGIVAACTDGTPEMERDASTWRPRREAHIAKLRLTENIDALRVSCADKLHNARSILIDLRAGEDVWKRFNVPDPAQQLWYYRELVQVFEARLKSPRWLPDELKRAVGQIGELAGA
jgi:(p)ppGpp synthase/HD superfamily hydrolase